MRDEQLNREAQALAAEAAQRVVWALVVERFRELQDRTGLKQADLSRRLGVSNPQIHEWLSDHRNMSLKAAGRLLAAMNCSLLCALTPLAGEAPASVTSSVELDGHRLAAGERRDRSGSLPSEGNSECRS